MKLDMEFVADQPGQLPGRELLVPVVEGFVEAVGPDGVRLGPEALRDGDEVAGRES
jgi:hypothetical protein